MKTSKKMLTVVLGAALIAGLLPVSSYSKPKKGQKSAIQQLQDFFAKEEAAEKEVAVSAATEKRKLQLMFPMIILLIILLRLGRNSKLLLKL